MSFKVGAVLVYCVLLVASVQGGLTGRIVGGKAADQGQIPYQVSVRMDGSHVCGGSIISENFILTAAHCVVDEQTQPEPASIFSIRAGSVNRSYGGVVVRVKSITINPKYEGAVQGDVALLELEQPLTFSEFIQPIELETEKVSSGTNVIISGWGLEENGARTIPEKLQYNILKTISSLQCFAEIGVFSEQILCLSHEPKNGACSGDSGGPAATNGKLVGVAGFVTPSCGTANPDGYAKVSYHVDWIKSVIG